MKTTPITETTAIRTTDARAADSVSDASFLKGYEERLADMDAIPSDALVQINVDIPPSVTTALGCAPRVLLLRPTIVEELPKFPVAHVDSYRSWALALGHSHNLYIGATEPVGPIQAYVDELMVTRPMLVTAVQGLVFRKLLDGAVIGELRGTSGYANTAWDTQTLVTHLRTHWSSVAGKAGVSIDELDRADKISTRLLVAVGEREQEAQAASDAADRRQRAFTGFLRTHTQLQRAIAYLRFDHGDADAILPSLYAHKKSPKRPAEDDSLPGVGTPLAPAAPIVGPALPNGNSASAAAGSNGVVLSPAPLPGMPGSPPFSR